MHSQAATHLQIRMYKCLTLHWFSSKCISELWLLIVVSLHAIQNFSSVLILFMLQVTCSFPFFLLGYNLFLFSLHFHSQMLLTATSFTYLRLLEIISVFDSLITCYMPPWCTLFEHPGCVIIRCFEHGIWSLLYIFKLFLCLQLRCSFNWKERWRRSISSSFSSSRGTYWL